MNMMKAILFATIFSFLILACETVKESTAPSVAPPIDQAIIGKWGLSPAMVKASGTNIIAYDFHADGTVTRMIVVKNDVVQTQGMGPVKFQANNGTGQLESGSKNPINFTYSISGDVLKFDSDDPIFGANGLHQTLYRVAE
jgi:hypothetical protein